MPAVFGEPDFQVVTDKTGRAMVRFSLPAPAGVDTRPLLFAIGRVMRAAFARNIDSGGNPSFAPLTKKTLKQKERLGYPADPLIRTRLLRNSLARRGSTGNITYVTSGGVLVLGTNLRYAAVHQDGGGNSIPSRPFLSLQEQDWDAINRLIEQFAAGLTITAEAT